MLCLRMLNVSRSPVCNCLQFDHFDADLSADEIVGA